MGGGAPFGARAVLAAARVVAAALALWLLAAACGADGTVVGQDARGVATGKELSQDADAVALTQAVATSKELSQDDGGVAPTQVDIPAQVDARGDELPSYIRRGWRTDFGRLTVDAGEIVAAGKPRDGIVAIDEPKFVIAAEARHILDDEPVVVVEIEGKAKAYPLAIMMRHEVVNDVVGGVAVAVTYCPLCNSAVAFGREVDGRTLDFGVTGNLRFSDLLMWDRQTESWWQQISGAAIAGELAGKRLDVVPAAVVAWGEFRRAHPTGKALLADAGAGLDYDAARYAGYDGEWGYPHMLGRAPDLRLPSMERALGLAVNGQARAYPFSALADARVVNDSVGGESVVVFYEPGALSPFAGADGGERRAVGAATAYQASVGGIRLTFELRDGRVVDRQTGSEWSALGRATAGELAGERLRMVEHGTYFWFAWAAFYPGTEVWDGE